MTPRMTLSLLRDAPRVALGLAALCVDMAWDWLGRRAGTWPCGGTRGDRIEFRVIRRARGID